MAFNHKRANFWLPNLGFFVHFSASLNEVCIKVNITVQKKFF